MDDIDYMYFRCEECNAHALIARYEDPTTASGACKTCGSRNWSLHATDITKKEMFMMKLKGESINRTLRSRIKDRIA